MMSNNLLLNGYKTYNGYAVCFFPKTKTEMEGKLGNNLLRYQGLVEKGPVCLVVILRFFFGGVFVLFCFALFSGLLFLSMDLCYVI